MVYTPPNATEVDFELLSYTAPNSDEVNFIRNEGGTLVSGAGHQTSRAYAPIVPGLDFDLLQYSPPLANNLLFSYVYGALAKGRQVSYHLSEVAQIQPVSGEGHQESYFGIDGFVVRIPGWDYYPDYSEYIEIVVDASKIDEDLYNFPIMVKISDSSGITGENVSSLLLVKLHENKYKFIIHMVTGEVCYVEIEDWEYGDGWATLHAKVPYISSTQVAKLRLYFDVFHEDNSGYVGDIGSTPGQSVWDQYFKQVYHLNGVYTGGAEEVKDSTIGAFHLTCSGALSASTQVQDLIGYSQDFDGINDKITGEPWNVTGVSALTFEVSYRPDVLSSDYGRVLVACKNEYIWERYFQLGCLDVWLFGRAVTSDQNRVSISTDTLSTDTWQYAALTFGDGYLRLFVDGTQRNQAVATGVLRWPGNYSVTDIWSIGYEKDFNDPPHDIFYDGTIDEVRVSTIKRTPAWVKATHYSLLDNLLTYTVHTATNQQTLGEAHQTSYASADLDIILPGWNLDNFLNIRIDSSKIDEDLYNFPVRIRIGVDVGLTSLNNAWIFNKIGQDKYKITVQHELSGAETYVEIEDWEYGDGWAELHAKVPYIPSSFDSDLRLYFDPVHDDNTGYVGVAGGTFWDIYYDNQWTDVTLSGYNIRNTCLKEKFSKIGNKIRVIFAHHITDYIVSACYVGLRASSGDPYDFASTPVQVTFGGNNSTTITSTNRKSDPIDFIVDGTTDIIVSFYRDSSSVPRKLSGNTAYGLGYWKLGSDESNVLDVTGYSSGSTYIYGVVALEIYSPVVNVWDESFVHVYHLNGDYTGSERQVIDSTGNNQLRTSSLETSPDKTLGIVGNSQEFISANDDKIYGTGWNTWEEGAPEALTMEVLFVRHAEYEVLPHVANIVAFHDTGQYSYGAEVCITADGAFTVRFDNDWYGGATSISNDTLYYLAGTAISTVEEHSAKLYSNGNFVSGATPPGESNIFPFKDINIGWNSWYGITPEYSYFDGLIDEVRISSVKRSAAWIKATYHSLMDTLLTYSLPERERHGEGYQTSYFTAEIFANSIISRGRQWGYSIGSVVQVQSISVSGYQTSYAVSFVSQIQVISVQGHQTSYARGITGVKAPQKIPISVSGHQTSYSVGSVTQVQPVSASGHQTSYVYIRYFVYVTALDVYLKAEFYGVRIENNNHGVEEV